MSTHSHEMPDFGHFEIFDHKLVGEKVLWPLVDGLWGDNWRKNSFLGNELHITRRGNTREGLVDVGVSAYTTLEVEDDLESEDAPILSTVEVTIHQHITDERRDMMIDIALAELEEDESDDEDELTINDFDDLDEVQARIISSYLIDTDNELQVHTGQALTDEEGYSAWTSRSLGYLPELDPENPETVIHDVIPSRLHKHDMELLESGLAVFNAPKALIKTLKTLKQYPV